MDHNAYYALLPEANAQLEKSVFLMAGGSEHNPMTIGWAEFGYVWGRPVVTVFVRKSRHTYSLMEKTDVFTVSVPKYGELAAALAYCGSHSGRDVDKLAQTGLSVLPARAGGADGMAGCAMHFECRIVFKAESDLANMDASIKARFYGSNQALGNGDPHVVYFGEVLDAYRE